jgi:hypothetical protein
VSLSGYGCCAFGGAKHQHSLPIGLNGRPNYAGTFIFLRGKIS